MASLELLKTEIDTDPLARGYSGMTDQQVTDSLNVEDRSRLVDAVPASGIFQAIDPSEYGPLSAAQKGILSDIFSLDQVFTSGNTSTALLAIFAAGTTTRANLIDLATVEISRGVEIGHGPVHLGDVTHVRNLP